ncbi:MAG: ribosome biogenesis factor YjgA [Pseudomonadota bacterium]
MEDLEHDDGPSKSQRKRDAQALQALAVSLVELSDEQLARIPLPEKLHDAIVETRRITSHGALRRQHQYLGKLMRRAEHEPIREALAQLEREAAGQTQHFHTLERWRDRLLAEGDAAIDELLASFPQLERPPLRHFVRRARQEREANRPPRSARALFRHLRERIEAPTPTQDEDAAPD